MKSKNVISSLPSKWFSLLTSESKMQRPVAQIIEDGNKTWEFDSVEEAMESKDIVLSGSPDCTQ